jgi:glucose-1-phosphate thymidylyltransferase
MTSSYSKQLVPIYDKPMIYYPLSILMLSGVKDIILITTPHDKELFVRLLGDGSRLGIKLTYKVQEKPRGLPDAFVVCKEEIAGEDVLMILGDNLFYGDTFINSHIFPAIKNKIPTIFAHKVKDARSYGVVEFDENYNVKSIEEKPDKPKSNYAITGLYYFDKNVSELAEKLLPSKRGEVEIIDLIQQYVNQKNLNVELLGRGIAWLDSGTHESLLNASMFIHTIEKRQGFKIACVEEIALRMGFINISEFEKLTEKINGSYGDYLREILLEEKAK